MFSKFHKTINDVPTLWNPIESFYDNRGVIIPIINKGEIEFGSVFYIDSVANALRANHFHKEDYHLTYIIKGKMKYFERPVSSKIKPEVYEFGAGNTFFTRPMYEHAMLFLEDSQIVCLSKLSRVQDDYEQDTVRLDFDLTREV
jgi:dTDP-4-dehydrorhamnose 3,5-epimerase-like enzyme